MIKRCNRPTTMMKPLAKYYPRITRHVVVIHNDWGCTFGCVPIFLWPLQSAFTTKYALQRLQIEHRVLKCCKSVVRFKIDGSKTAYFRGFPHNYH